MSQKSLSVVIVMLAFCTTLMAEDKQTPNNQIAPFLGVWELDVKKTANNEDMVSQMFVNAPVPGGGFISTRAMIHTENKSNTEIHPYAFDGKPHRSSGSDVRDFYYKLIDPLTIERTYERNGEKIVDHEQVSKDGKTMTVTQPNGRVRIYHKTFDIKPGLRSLDSSAQQPARTGLLSERGLTTADFPQNKKLASNVYVWTDVHPTGLYTTNDLIVITPNGVLVADGQKDPATTKKMVDFIKSVTSQPIRYVVVASEHGDHSGGHESFPPGAVFISSPASQANLQAQASNDKPGRPKTIVPTQTVADRSVLKIGTTEIQILNMGRAHTGGDLEVYLPAEKILFVSEVFSNHLFPQMRAAPPKEWIQTLRKVQKIDATWIIPGHGFIDDAAVLKDELANYTKMMEYVVPEITRLHDAGVPASAALKQANWGPYSSWPVFDRNGQVAVQRIYDEIDGKLD